MTVSHEAGAELTARSPRGAQVYAGAIAVVTPVSSTKTSRSGSIRWNEDEHVLEVSSRVRAVDLIEALGPNDQANRDVSDTAGVNARAG